MRDRRVRFGGFLLIRLLIRGVGVLSRAIREGENSLKNKSCVMSRCERGVSGFGIYRHVS